MINLPIYRAKKLGTKDEYVEGNLVEIDNEYFIVKDTEGCYLASDCFHYLPYNEIDPTTLSIHFQNMLDVKGDKIFASLNEDGKGGDILFDMEYEYTLYFDGLKFKLQGVYTNSSFNKYDSWENFDIIGIEE